MDPTLAAEASKTFLDALMPMFITVGKLIVVSIVAGAVGYMSAQRLVAPWSPRLRPLAATFISIGSMLLANYSDFFPELTWSPKSWALCVLVGLGGSGLYEALDEYDVLSKLPVVGRFFQTAPATAGDK